MKITEVEKLLVNLVQLRKGMCFKMNLGACPNLKCQVMSSTVAEKACVKEPLAHVTKLYLDCT